MKIVVGGKYLIKHENVNHRRAAIIIDRIDFRGTVYFHEYPSRDPIKMYCDKRESLEKFITPYMLPVNKLKIINRRRASTFKPK